MSTLDLEGGAWGDDLHSCPKEMHSGRMFECRNRATNALKVYEKQQRSQFSRLMKLSQVKMEL